MKNSVCNYDRFHVERRNTNELGFTNNKVLLSHFEPPKFNIAFAIHVMQMQLRWGHVTAAKEISTP